MENYAETYKRIFAFVCDSILNVILLFVFTTYLGIDPLSVSVYTLESGININFSLLGAIIFVMYFTFFDFSSLRGSIGKRMVGISVVSNNRIKLKFHESLIRAVFKLVSCACFFIGFLPVFFSHDKKALHDKLVGSIVIDDSKN